MTDWPRLFDDHDASVQAFVTCAARIPRDRWNAPRAPGKWSPAQEAEHLRLAYILFAKAFRDGYRARPMVSRRSATFLRWSVIPAMRMLGWFPSGARSPHDARPAPSPGRQDLLIAQLKTEATAFENVVRTLVHEDPDRAGYHPYFGDIRLRDIVTLASGHTRHHLAHLRPLATPGSPAD